MPSAGVEAGPPTQYSKSVISLAFIQKECRVRLHMGIGFVRLRLRGQFGPRFQVKRIMVKPGARLSLQMHHRDDIVRFEDNCGRVAPS